MGCGAELVKFILILFNALCLACGIYIIVYCYPIVKEIHNLSTMKEHLIINIIAIVPLVLGGLILVMSLLGCCGALRGNPCQLRAFSAIMMVLFIGTVALIIFVYTKYDKMVSLLERFINETWATYSDHEPSRKIFHNLEMSLKCCGKNGYRNYHEIYESIPSSCCGLKTGQCHEAQAFKSGCLHVVTLLWESHAKVIKFGAIAASGVTLLASTFASYLAHKMVRSVEYDYDYD